MYSKTWCVRVDTRAYVCVSVETRDQVGHLPALLLLWNLVDQASWR